MSSKKSKKRAILTVFIIFVVIMMTFLLFPRRYSYPDGGTTGYRGFMFIYLIENRHSYYEDSGSYYYEEGTVITILGIEVYNGTSVNYDNPAILPHTTDHE